MKTQPLIDQSPPESTRALLEGIWRHLSHRRRIQLGLLLIVMLASGGAELLSLGAVLPFLAVLSNPEQLWQQPLMQRLAAQVGLTEANQLMQLATTVFVAAAVLAAHSPGIQPRGRARSRATAPGAGGAG